MKPATVPEASKFPELGEHRFRNVISEPVVQAQAESHPTSTSQGDVVPRQVDPLESVVLFEVAQAIPLLVPIGELGVHEERNPPLGAGPDRLGDESIRRSPVPVTDHRHDLHQARLNRPSSITSLTKPIGYCPRNAPRKTLLSRKVPFSL